MPAGQALRCGWTGLDCVRGRGSPLPSVRPAGRTVMLAWASRARSGDPGWGSWSSAPAARLTAWHLLRRARDELARRVARVRPCRLRIPGTWPDLPPGLRRPAVCRDGQAGPAAPAGTGGRHRAAVALRSPAARSPGPRRWSDPSVGSVAGGWRVAGGGWRVAGCCARRDGDAATVWPVAGAAAGRRRSNRVAGRRSENVHASWQVPARSERSGAKQARMGPFMSRLRGRADLPARVWTETDRPLLA